MAEYLTPQQVAERWQCSPEHVTRLCRRRELAAMLLGRKGWRIKPESVAAYEMRQANEPEAAPELTTLAARPAPVAAPIALDGWRPENPCFPELWS